MKFLTLFLSVLVLFACTNEPSAIDMPWDYPKDCCMHPEMQITFVKTQISEENEPYYSAFLQLIYYADLALNISSNVPTDYYVPGAYDDYANHVIDSKPLQDDAFNAYCTALAYTLTKEEKYGLKACYFLDAWAIQNKSYSGHDGSLCMCYSGSGLLIAAELMKESEIWSQKIQFKSWVENVYQKAAKNNRTLENNWGDWGVFASLLAASFTENQAELLENIRLLKSRFNNISADGSIPAEVARGDNGIWYTYFALAPFTASCWCIYNLTGENLFQNSSLKKALDYLLYYTQNPKEWKWYNNPVQGSPNSWPGNLFEAMYGVYHDNNYLQYVKNYRPIIYPIHHFVWTFPTLMPLSIGQYEN